MAPQNAQPTITLYSMVICPFAQRTRMHLNIKGIEHELVNLDICAPRPDWYLALNPNGQVPTLTWQDDVVSDSNIVSEYIEDRFVEPALPGSDPMHRARVRTLMKYADNTFIPALYHLMAASTAEERNKRIERAQASWSWVNSWLENAYAAGYPEDAQGLAEVVLAPFLLRYEVVAYYQDLDFSTWPEMDTMLRWRERLLAEDAVRNTAEPVDDLIKMYEDYTLGYFNGAVPPGRTQSSSDLSTPIQARPMPAKAASVR